MVHKVKNMDVNIEKVMLLGTPETQKEQTIDTEKTPTKVVQKNDDYEDDAIGDWESGIDEFKGSLGSNYHNLKKGLG
jgi:bacterioferritin (cytochrome b1)